MATFTERLVGAAALNGAIYEEVERDRGATAQGAAIVLLGSVAAGLASAGVAALRPAAILTGALGGLVAWISWAAVTYLIGTRVLPGPDTRADLGELLRTLAFASTPGLLQVVGIVPMLRWPSFAVTSIWMFVAMVVAVKHALDYEHVGRAVAVCVLGWLLSIMIAVVIGVVFPTPVS